MSASVLDMSMSLDGYIADPNDFLGGDDGERLHKWADADTSASCRRVAWPVIQPDDVVLVRRGTDQLHATLVLDLRISPSSSARCCGCAGTGWSGRSDS